MRVAVVGRAAACLVLAMAALGARAACAQTERFIVPFEAGSSVDVYARVIAAPLSKALDRSVIVENRPGAAGGIGAFTAAREPADGLTLLAGTAALCEINPLVFSNQRWSMKDFAPLVKGVQSPLVLVVHPSVPAKTLDELVAWIKSKPGQLNYASYSPGAPGHFLGAKLNQAFGLDLTHAPYRGSASQVNALIAGQSLIGFAQTQNAAPYVESGALRAIAITSGERFRVMPDVPTFRELSHPDFTTNVWYGLLARAGLPPDALRRLTEAAAAAHADPIARATLEKQGYELPGETGEAFARSIAQGTARWAELVKATGFKADE